MTLRRYSFNESVQRLVKLFKGETNLDDTPGMYGQESWEESISDIVELSQDSYPGVTGTVPHGLRLQNSHLDTGAHLSVHQQGIGPQRIGTGENYTSFNASGTMRHVGAATVFTDMSITLTTDRQGSNNKPDYDYTNLGLSFPQNDATEQVNIITQFDHKKRLNTSIFPHVHYIQTSASKPTFQYVYKWYNNGGHVPDAWTSGSTADGNSGVFTYTSGSMLQIASFPEVVPPMASEGVSSNFEMILWRNDNVVTGDVLTKYIDIHYEIDSAGSDSQYVKGE